MKLIKKNLENKFIERLESGYLNKHVWEDISHKYPNNRKIIFNPRKINKKFHHILKKYIEKDFLTFNYFINRKVPEVDRKLSLNQKGIGRKREILLDQIIN